MALRIPGLDLAASIQVGVDFQKVADSGIGWVAIQASLYSGGRAPGYYDYLTKAKAAGLARGAYHFAYCGSDPVAQAKFAFAASGGVGLAGNDGELPPILDLEYAKDLSPEVVVAWGEAYAETMVGLCKRPKIWLYTYPWFWRSLGARAAGSRKLLQFAELYIASYRTGPDGKIAAWTPSPTDQPTMLAPWTEWRAWQHGNVGLPCPGVPGPVDRDFAQAKDEDEWAAICQRQKPVDSGVLGPAAGG